VEEDRNPNDQPGGDAPLLEPGPAEAEIDYRRERLNQNLRSGGRGCFFPGILMAGLPVAILMTALTRFA
jgi:hypothetical protein